MQNLFRPITLIRFFFGLSMFSPLYLRAEGDANMYRNLDDRDRQLTTEQEKQAESYVHKGYIQKKYNEACSNKENRDACEGNEAQAMGDMDNMVPAVSKMYSLFLTSDALKGADAGSEAGNSASHSTANGGTNAGGTTAGGETAGAQGAEQAKKGDGKSSPYCDFIPPATEGAAAVSQDINQKEIASGPVAPGAEQRENLFKVARTHKSRSETALVQTAGWGVTASCYVATAVGSGGLGAAAGAADTKSVLKLAAAVGLAGFYGMKAQAHLDYENKTKNIAKSLPGAGACNPITEVNCFCTEPSSQQDTSFTKTCIPGPFQNRARPGVVAVSCIDASKRADPNCECLRTNTCFDTAFRNFSAGLDFGTASVNDTLSGVRDISRGSLDSGRVQAATFARLARARDVLNKTKLPDSLENASLSPSLQKESDVLERLGVPRRFARALVKAVPPNSQAAALIGSGLPRYYANYNPTKKGQNDYGGKIIDYGNTGRSRVGNFGSTGFTKSNPFDKFLPNNKTGRTLSREEVLVFEQEAMKGADITKDTSASLFQIISHRYRNSAWREFDIMELISDEKK